MFDFDPIYLIYVLVAASAGLFAEGFYLLCFTGASYRNNVNRRLKLQKDQPNRENILIQLRRERVAASLVVAPLLRLDACLLVAAALILACLLVAAALLRAGREATGGLLLLIRRGALEVARGDRRLQLKDEEADRRRHLREGAAQRLQVGRGPDRHQQPLGRGVL